MIGSEAIVLTEEQRAIIESGTDLRINAVAGSGKTSTVLEYAATRPAGARILYIAFNKTVKTEARRRFDAMGLNRVRVETAHSLAFNTIVSGSRYQVRSSYAAHELVMHLGIGSGSAKLHAFVLANHVNRFVACFCNSTVPRPEDLDYLSVLPDEETRKFASSHAEEILVYSRRFLEDMFRGRTPMIHDFYLKLYQLRKPVLPFDYILFDEGQDASPAMLDIFIRQNCRKLIVGDMHQQIYGWRYAINSLEKVLFPRAELSLSFRFGPEIALLAKTIIGWKQILGADSRIKINGEGKPVNVLSRATLSRTNMGLLLKAVAFVKKDGGGKMRIYFEGNINSYTYADDGASLYDVLNLHLGNTDRIRDQLVAGMQDITELKEYVEQTGDVQMGLMVQMVEEYGEEIPSILKQLKARHVDESEKEKAGMIFSTVHRCKGMEYDQVELADDFITESRLEKIREEALTDEAIKARYVEEINLLYVAVTRVRKLLLIPKSMVPKGFQAGASVIVLEKEEYRPESRDNQQSLKAIARKRVARPGIERSHQPWTEEDDDELRRRFHVGMTIPDLCIYFARSRNAIFSRLKKLGCVQTGAAE